jgi:hypothetical protein
VDVFVVQSFCFLQRGVMKQSHPYHTGGNLISSKGGCAPTCRLALLGMLLFKIYVSGGVFSAFLLRVWPIREVKIKFVIKPRVRGGEMKEGESNLL